MNCPTTFKRPRVHAKAEEGAGLIPLKDHSGGGKNSIRALATARSAYYFRWHPCDFTGVSRNLRRSRATDLQSQALEMRIEDAFDFCNGIRVEEGFVAVADDQFGFRALEMTAR